MIRFASVVGLLVSISWPANALKTEPSTDQLILKLDDRTLPANQTADDIVGRFRGGLVNNGFETRLLRKTSSGAYILKLNRFAPVGALKVHLSELSRAQFGVAYFEPDVIAQLAQVNDPAYNQQWSLTSASSGINVSTAWNYSSGSGVTIAVIDTGVTTHQDLAGNSLSGYDFISSASNSNDGDGRDSSAQDPGDWRTAGQCIGNRSYALNSSWHGTFVSGIAAAVTGNGIGIAGVSYGSKILPVRVLGTCGGYSSDIADGIAWAAGVQVPGVPTNTNPARVINLSLVGQASCPSVLQIAINTARSLGTVVVAAAGNDAADVSTTFPANCNGVIAVAATDSVGSRASFSNYGSLVSLAAPGVSILSTTNLGSTAPIGEGYALDSGTSYAAPLVSGAAALMLSANSVLIPDDIRLILNGTASPFSGNCGGCGSGVLNAGAAVYAVRSGAPQGTLYQTYATRQGSSSSILVITNSGPGWLTGLRASCRQNGASITTQPISALAPGQSTTIQSANSPYYYTCGFVVQANNASNSPYVNNGF